MSEDHANLHYDERAERSTPLWSQFWDTTTTMHQEPEEPSYDVTSREVHPGQRMIHVVPTPPQEELQQLFTIRHSAPLEEYWAPLSKRAQVFLDPIYRLLVEIPEDQLERLQQHATITTFIEAKPASSSYTQEHGDVIDWDITIDTPHRRAAGTIHVTLKYAGRSTPSPIDNPWQD